VDESADAEGRLELASAYDADGSSNGSNSEPNGQSNGGSNGLADQNGGVNEVQQLNSELAVAEDEVNKTQLDNNELRERNSLLEAQVSTLATLAEVAEEQAEAVPAKAKPVTKADPTAMEKATKAADSLVLLLEKKPMYAWGGLAALVLLVVILFLWLTRKRTIDVNDFPIRPLPVPPEEVIIDTGADQLIDDAEGGHLNPDESLFDETDKEIFAEEDSKVSKEIFGSMVEAMEEAEVYVSLGDTDGAIRVLERARRVSASDTACRLRLMELLFKEGSTDKLKLIAEEINKTEDEEAMAMAAVIVGDKQEMTLNPASLAVDEKPTLEEPSPFQEPSADDSMFDEEEPSVAQWGEPAADESTADEEPSASLNEEPSAALNEDNEPSASPNEEPSAALNEEHDPSEEDSAADTELTLDEEPSASLNEELSAVLDKEHEPSVAPNEELPEVDSLEELESSGDAAIDELAESVLDEDFLDDSFLDGGIFADVGQATEPKEHKVPEDLGLQVDAEDLPGTADLENSMGDEAAAIAEFMASLDDFDGAEDAEEISSVDVKLDLANTFIEMGDPEGAREILKEIIGEADQAGQARAQLVLETLG
jgi:FimV-like protein